jgi:uncharacterized membrane protein HdeD (DUF308 family)
MRMWWIVLVRAVVALVLGVAVLLSEKTRPALGNFIAVYWLLGSILTLRWFLEHRPRPGSRLALTAALVGIVAGVLVLLRFLLRDAVSADAVLALLGVAAVLTGVLRLSGAFHDDQVAADRPRLPHRVALGVLELAMGAVLLLAHDLTRPVAIVAGLWGLAGGTILLLDALALRRMHRPVAEP